MINIRVTRTFNKSLDRLPKQEANLVKQTMFDVMASPESRGHRLHPLNMSGKKFWSISPNMDLRIITWKDGEILTALHVGHHDAAHRWAARWTLKPHEHTGAMQLVPDPVMLAEDLGPPPPAATPFFAEENDDYLLSLGVPPEVLDVVKQVATVDQLSRLVDELPEEAGVALLDLHDGKRPSARPVQKDLVSDPFDHPDARRRFWVASSEAVLAEILERPWEEWMIFLHPTQQDAVDRSFSGPARITGAAGTGKTVVAMHRAARLARAGGRVLLTTYSRTLDARLYQNVDRLLRNDPETRQRIEVSSLHRLAWGHARLGPDLRIIDTNGVRELVAEERGTLDPALNDEFLITEWESVIDYWGINTLEQYEGAERVGRGSALQRERRRQIWEVFERVRNRMDAAGFITFADLCDRARAAIETDGTRPYRHVIVDETQDFGPREIQLLMALGGGDHDVLFFAGDVGQRIYTWPFPWKKLGIDLRGNAIRLKVNCRTTDEIRRFSEALLPAALSQPDDESTAREARSLLRGARPEMVGCKSEQEESEVLARWLSDLIANGITRREIAIFGRTRRILQACAEPALRKLRVKSEFLTRDRTSSPETVVLGTLHNAKGLEFRAVAVVGCSSWHIPYGPELRRTPEELHDLIKEKERNLLYVGCSRARETLLVTWSGRPSPYLVGAKKSC